jgi:hypothetical protein
MGPLSPASVQSLSCEQTTDASASNGNEVRGHATGARLAGVELGAPQATGEPSCDDPLASGLPCASGVVSELSGVPEAASPVGSGAVPPAGVEALPPQAGAIAAQAKAKTIQEAQVFADREANLNTSMETRGADHVPIRTFARFFSVAAHGRRMRAATLAQSGAAWWREAF